jgi:membrane protein required for colicin V production
VTGLDIAIIVLLGASTAVSLVRGIMREVLSLVAWAAAFGVAVLYVDRVSGLFAGFIHIAWLRYVVGFLLILIATLIVASMLSRFISMVVKTSGMGINDRLLGMVFGFARGIVVVALLTVLMSAMPVVHEAWWKESKLIPYFRGGTQWLMKYAPRAEIDHVMDNLSHP